MARDTKTKRKAPQPPSEQELNAIRQEALEFAGIGLYRFKFDGTVVFMDRGAIRIFGLEDRYPNPAAATGKKIGEFFEYLEPQGRLRAEIRKYGHLRGFKYHFRTLSGVEKWVTHDSYLVRDPESGEEVIQVVVNDTTERQRAEEELQHVLSSARCILWHATVDERPDHTFGWDIHVSNEVAAQRLLPLERAAGQTYSEAWHNQVIEEDRLRMDEVSTGALKAGWPGYSQEYRCQLAGGGIRWLSEDTRIYPLAPDRWFLVGVCTDITPYKQAEEALRKSEARYRAVIEDQPDLICRYNRDERLTFVNEAYCRYFNKRRQDLVGHSFLPMIPDREREWVRKRYLSLTPQNPTTTYEYQLKIPGGEVRWQQWTDRAIFDEAGQFIEFQSVGRDITERKLADDRQRAVTAGLRAVLAVTDELISCPDIDTLHRRAVELAREKLGLERCGIFMREGQLMRGTFGTDMKGRTTDEHGHSFQISKDWLERFQSLRPQDSRMIIVEQPYVEFVDGVHIEHEKGWIAVTPLLTTTEFIGVLCNDTAMSRRPINDAQQEVVSVFCSLLGVILERKRIENRQRAMSVGLRAVLSVTDELISCADVDSVCRRAVELAREKLDIERCAVFLKDAAGLAGTYGTSLQRMTTDEHHHGIPSEQDWLQQLQAQPPDERQMILSEEPYSEWLENRVERFDRGWVALTPIQSATELIGVFSNDTAISRTPIDPGKQELVRLLCSMLAAVIQRKRAEAELRRLVMAVVTTADELIACPDTDTVYRRAVELAREKLGVERCAIFTREGNELRGTYGTDREGRTTDEHRHIFNTPDDWLQGIHDLRLRDSRFVFTNQPYFEWKDGRETQFGRGWTAVTPIQSATEVLGVFCNDTAITGKPIDQTQQEIVTIFCSLLAAILQRKRVEIEIRRMAMAIEQAAEAIVITDTQGAIQYVNPAFERISGYSREEALGKNPRILKSGKQDTEFYRRMWSILTAGGIWHGHFANQRKDGSLYEVEASISPIRDTAGRTVSYVAASRDVTHEMQLEQQMRQAQKMEAIGRLAGGIAHDFNNLLTSILGYSHLVWDELDEGHPMRSDLDEIIRAGDRAAALTKQLLAFSRKEMIQAKPVNLNAVVMDLDKLLRRTLGEDIELVTVVDSEMGRVKADAGLLEQVVMNLAINARDAMPKGGTLTIQTSIIKLSAALAKNHPDARPGEYVALTVRDTGVGMSEEVREHCFEPFYTTKEAGKGTGLGLSIVYSIIKQFDGFVEIESQVNAGTAIHLYLPSIKDSPLNIPTRELVELPRGTETILVVEDEDTVRRLVIRLLESLGYQVLQARHGGEALIICERHKGRIHLVLTDVVMPSIGGQELIERLLKIRTDFKVLYMSGFTDAHFVERGLGDQRAPLLVKPFTNEALAKKVRNVLDAALQGR